MTIIPTIIDQHAENAAFNWLLRDRAVSEPHHDLADLADLDERVEANIDGLRIAGDDGWEICREAMELTEEAGEVFTAGVIAFESKHPERMDVMLAAVEQERALQRALSSALGWIELEQIAETAQKLLRAELPFLRFIGLSTHAIHRRDPGPVLSTLIEDADPDVRARALKAVGELGRVDLLPHLLDHLNDTDPQHRFYAAWSSTLLGDDAGVDVLRTIAESGNAYAARACTTTVRKVGPADAGNWLENLHRQTGNARLVIGGWGALGDPVAIPFLLEQMRIPELARPAGEAFSMITGVDIAYQNLESEWPDGFEAGPTEDPEDDNVEMDPDEELPWPDAALLEAWWVQNEKTVTPGTRYLLGEPVGPATLTQALKNGYQRQRIAAALELAIANPGATFFECRVPGFRQQKMLGIKQTS